MNRYDEQMLNEDIDRLQDDVPDMPEGLHDAWMQRIQQEPQSAPLPRRSIPLRTYLTRIAAAAAAAVFVIGGATMTARQLPSANTAQKASGMVNGAAMYTRSTSDMAESYDGAAYDSGYGMMLTAGSGNPQATQQERKIIHTVSLTITTDSFASSLDSLRGACEGSGGWIESITESGEIGDRRAWMTLRIPAGALEDFLAQAGAAGRVTNRSESATDVTEPYYDTQAQLQSQQALYARLQELIGMAETLEDILALESQLADTQYEIERLQDSLHRTDRQVDYATVDITLREETPADQASDEKLTLSQRLSAAIEMGGSVFLSFLQDAAVWLVSALPFAGVVAAAWCIWALIRRIYKKKRS